MIEKKVHSLISEKLEGIQNLLQQRTKKERNLHSLFTGGYGEVLLVLKDESFDAWDGLVELFNAINTSDSSTLCNGLAGIGWFIQYAIKEEYLDKADYEEILLQIDTVTYNSALSFLKEGNHDYLHGATGVAVYLLDRMGDNPLVGSYLDTILQGINQLASKKLETVYWNDSKFYMQEEAIDQNVVNLSLSHGLAGKIVLLSKMYQKNISKELCKELLVGSIAFLRNNKNPEGSNSIYPSIVGDSDQKNSRLAWCYGDLGVSIALWQAGEVLEDAQIKEEAIATCLHTTKRNTIDATGAYDVGFCHGSAGIAHMYNRMFRYTGLNEFKVSANFWINKTISMASYEDGLEGFKNWNVHEEEWENNYGLLDGIAGVGLVLHAHAHAEEPTWDRCMLLS